MPSTYTAKQEIIFENGWNVAANDPLSAVINPDGVTCNNSASAASAPVPDMGADGTGTNANVAKDAYSFNLNYFGGDYDPISDPHGNNYAPPVAFPYSNTGASLYNGNISSMAVNIPVLGNAQLYGYRYDQLNRITAMDVFTGLNTTNNGWSPVPTQDYHESYV
jgi:hypothetical protein